MKKLLGDHQITVRFFDGLDSIFEEFKKIKKLHENKRQEIVGKTLLELIQNEKDPCFLLPAVLEFVVRVDEEKIISNYSFNRFESWLNQGSGLSLDENLIVRGKIAGKKVERGDYQILFPIGMGKMYEGTHFVTAHKSPDLDTTIASFWGWLDAFAAKVGDGLHVWNVPDGPPQSQIEIEWIFKDLFGRGIFSHLPKTRTMLNLSGRDLLTQHGMQQKGVMDSLAEIEHDRDAVVVVDDEGFFLGDWRLSDVEGVRQVIILVSSTLRWLESRLNLNLLSLFAKEKLQLKEVESVLEKLLHLQLKDSEPALEFSAKQKEQVDRFIVSVIGLNGGLEADFGSLAKKLCEMTGITFDGTSFLSTKMKKKGLFDEKGKLVDNRSKIFLFLAEFVETLHAGILKIRERLEKLDVALKTKFEVFEHHLNTVTVRSDVEEIRLKMGHYPYLTVVDPDHEHNRPFPVGIIHAANLRKATLGTVSLRDFCNRDEMGIPSYLEVISVIDHHKTALNTFTAPMAILSDAQSSNTLVAQKAFEINDCNRKKPHFIDPTREYVEYLHFLYGIIDDTDLLSKVSSLDVQCVAELLNRMKSLVMGKKTKLIDLSDFPRDKQFAKKSASLILQNEDMYSLYRKVYQYREEEVEKNIDLCVRGEPSNLFADTKEQNGCCRVGQTKIFAVNLKSFQKSANDIRKTWLQRAKKVQKEKSEIDLHIHMISTIVCAEEVYKGTAGKYKHKDELWIWIPENELAVEHLKRFLSSFQASPGLKNSPMEVEFLGQNAEELSYIFRESFVEIPEKRSDHHLNIAVLRYNAAALNSRKAMVSPFLPVLTA